MTANDDLDTGRRYPAQKTLQMKAGKGEISEARIARAHTIIEEKKKPLLLREVKNLVKPLQRHIRELEKMIEHEEFVSAPDKQAVINDIVSTLMNIKAHGDFTDVKPLTQLTSLVLLALDNGCKVDRAVKDALYEYASILEEYTEEQPPEDTLAVKRAVNFWKEAGLAHTAKSPNQTASGEVKG